ncbi:bifunctional glycosyltransferase family 2/GtrA family protein [Clostridium sp.]|uniref:bifunctional glycosyltransferase family 2/GtrA family protein n=1 Tax=Clostridium sp. TaxID=1506 RepID=UPI001A36451E|nr:bifunctional glycosyltransferase family 2/GtrA family protein [Clostridium sp.]MBK5242640.1 bifunctional glycosyltransferase family 2/GtrA family protein [Clostridium sp.]
MKPVIIIPTLNPDVKLINLVQTLKKSNFSIVIINDGSKKECNDILETLKLRFQCDILTHTKNMGKGASIKTGIRYASQKYPESSGYVTADDDGQHAAGDILKVVESLEKNSDSLILGSRNFSKKNVPFKSRWGNRITSVVFLMSTSKRCQDTQTGLRGIPKGFTQICLSVPGDRFEYEMNMLLEFARNKISTVHVPIATIYLQDNKSSHFNAIRDSVQIYLNILKYSISSMGSAIIDIIAFTILINLIFGKASAGILAATVVARVMSGGVNFMLNKHWVFKSENGHGIEIIKYLTLFCCQMILSWILVTSLSNLSLHLTIIKMLVDSTLFFISYQIQKKYIFSKTERVAGTNEKISIKTV